MTARMVALPAALLALVLLAVALSVLRAPPGPQPAPTAVTAAAPTASPTAPYPPPRPTYEPSVPRGGYPDPGDTPPPVSPSATYSGSLDEAELTIERWAGVFSGPHARFGVLGTLAPGTHAPVLARSADEHWWLITLPTGGEGWVYAPLVTANLDARRLPTSTPVTPPPEPRVDWPREDCPATPLPTSTPLPGPPADIDTAAALVLDYLNSHPDDLAGLRTQLAVAGWLGVRGDNRCIHERDGTTLMTWTDVGTQPYGEVRAVDLSGDGRDELVVVVGNVPGFAWGEPGDVLIVARDDGGRYALAYQLRAALDPQRVPHPVIAAIRDVNHDGRVELVLSGYGCGANVCLFSVYLITWDGARYHGLSEDWLGASYPRIAIGDRDGDGVSEITFEIAHPDGGLALPLPRRVLTVVYRWNGARYVEAQAYHESVDLLYWAAIDANDALVRGNLDQAARLYERLLSDSRLNAYWPEDVPTFAAFGGFRLVSVRLRQGRVGEAEAVLRALEQRYPGHPYTWLSRKLWDTYTQTGSVASACATAGAYSQAHPADLGFDYLRDVSVAPLVSPWDICGLAGSR